jgi:hypothetical protein|tara:strand:+ start:9650 stop:9913 length:264 start_codon:yes stop_codon:yes gene_type:complete
MNEYSRASILEAVLLERERQDALWGDQINNSDAWWNVIATEEAGEAAREVYERNSQKLFVELIQTCAVYYAWAEAVYRRRELDEKGS